MRIFIDIGHPAHVHYFRNFIKIMSNKGHQFLISARDKEVTHSLLNYYQIPFVSRGIGRKGYLGKAVYIFEADYKIYKITKKFNPDLFLSFGSAYAAHVSKVLGKPHIAFDDTDHAKFEHILYVPFTDYIFSPTWYKKNFGKKHKRFNGIMELTYLHPKYFEFNNYEINSDEEYIIFRLTSWDASHDFGYKTKLIRGNLINHIRNLSNKYKVLISSEGNLPVELEKFRANFHPVEMHNYLIKSLVCVTEGGTIANECALLGVPNILVNPISKFVGVHQYLKILGLQEHCDNFDEAIVTLSNWLKNIVNIRERFKVTSIKFINQSDDLTKFMVNLIENFPYLLKKQ